MSNIRQGLLGVVFAFLSGLVIFGGAVLSLVESNYFEEKAASATFLAAWDMSGIEPYTPVPGAPTFTAAPVRRETLTPTPTFGPVVSCPVPAGWVSVMTQVGDTLESLAQVYQVGPADIAQANCLASDQLALTPGIFLFVPAPMPTMQPSIIDQITEIPVTQGQPFRTATKYICGMPAGWVAYRVRSGDTLFSLSRLTGVSVYQIQLANCLGSSTLIVTGQNLYLPFIPVFPTLTPLPTWTNGIPAATLTTTIPPTFTVEVPSATPTGNIPTVTHTPEPAPTSTPTAPIETNTPAPSPPTDTSVPPTATSAPPSETPVPPSATPEPIPTETEKSILLPPTLVNSGCDQTLWAPGTSPNWI